MIQGECTVFNTIHKPIALGHWMQKAEYMIQDIGFRIQETGFRIKDSGFRNRLPKLILIEFFVNKKICGKRLQLRS
jgi:hypothetical protein